MFQADKSQKTTAAFHVKAFFPRKERSWQLAVGFLAGRGYELTIVIGVNILWVSNLRLYSFR